MDRYMLFPSGMGEHQNGSYVLFADAQATIAALQAQLTQLDRTLADVYAQRDGLQKDLAQRTAELEAIETILDIDSGKTTVDKVRDLHRAFKQVWESYQDASNEMFKAQAELGRVRGELATYKETKHDAI